MFSKGGSDLDLRCQRVSLSNSTVVSNLFHIPGTTTFDGEIIVCMSNSPTNMDTWTGFQQGSTGHTWESNRRPSLYSTTEFHPHSLSASGETKRAFIDSSGQAPQNQHFRLDVEGKIKIDDDIVRLQKFSKGCIATRPLAAEVRKSQGTTTLGNLNEKRFHRY